MGCPPPPLLGTSVLNVGSRDFLSHQGPLSLCPAEGAVGSGSETWRNSAGSGRGPSLPLLWKTKQALNPFLEELAPCPCVLTLPHCPLQQAHMQSHAWGGRRQQSFLAHPAHGVQRKNSAECAGCHFCHSPCACPELQGGQRDGMSPPGDLLRCRSLGMCPCWEGWGSTQCLLWAGNGRMELLWQWLICEQGWFVHVSLDSLFWP